MEDMQNQQPADVTPRRRRAVRSVPMGGGQSSQSAIPAAQQKAVPSVPDTSTVFSEERVSAVPTEPAVQTAASEPTVLPDASVPTEMPMTQAAPEPSEELQAPAVQNGEQILPS